MVVSWGKPERATAAGKGPNKMVSFWNAGGARKEKDHDGFLNL